MRRVLHIFAEFTDADLAFIARTGKVQPIATGTVLVHSGTHLDAMHIVLDGALEVRVGDRSIRQLYTGDVVGELSFLDRRPPSAEVLASEPSKVLSLSRADLDAQLARDTGFASRFYKSIGTFLAMRLRDVTESLAYGEIQLDPDELELDELDGADRAARQFAWLLENVGEG